MGETLLIVGTDTEVGKTVVTTALVSYWHKYYASGDLGLMKLIQAGVGDRELYQQLFELHQEPETIAPLIFDTPAAPPIAAEREGRRIDLAPVWQTLKQLQAQYKLVIVEALGGLGSPVTEELVVADLARDWGLSVVLVVPVRLGAIASAVANIALARACKLDIKGIILNCVQPVTTEEIATWTPTYLIQSLTQVPVLGIVPYLENPYDDREKLAQIASNLELSFLISQTMSQSKTH